MKTVKKIKETVKKLKPLPKTGLQKFNEAWKRMPGAQARGSKK